MAGLGDPSTSTTPGSGCCHLSGGGGPVIRCKSEKAIIEDGFDFAHSKNYDQLSEDIIKVEPEFFFDPLDVKPNVQSFGQALIFPALLSLPATAPPHLPQHHQSPVTKTEFAATAIHDLINRIDGVDFPHTSTTSVSECHLNCGAGIRCKNETALTEGRIGLACNNDVDQLPKENIKIEPDFLLDPLDVKPNMQGFDHAMASPALLLTPITEPLYQPQPHQTPLPTTGFAIKDNDNSGETCKTDKPFACPLCPRRFRVKSLLVYHLNGHTKEKVFFCLECYRLFESDKNLSIHLIFHRTHLKVGPFICPHCSKEFDHKYAWQRHVYDHEKKDTEILHSCHTCKMCFKSSNQFRRHKFKYHRDEMMKEKSECKKIKTIKTFVCPYCNKEVRSRRWKQHLNIHTEVREKNYVCSHCDKAFYNKYHLAKHELLHTDRDKAFVCHHCTSKFISKSALITHKMGCIEKIKKSCSSESTRHICPICKRGFVSEETLNKHIKVHNDRKREHICSICSKTFLHKSSRDKHKILYHKKDLH